MQDLLRYLMNIHLQIFATRPINQQLKIPIMGAVLCCISYKCPKLNFYFVFCGSVFCAKKFYDIEPFSGGGMGKARSQLFDVSTTTKFSSKNENGLSNIFGSR